MTDWDRPESMLTAGKALRYLVAAMWGVVGWEYLVTFDLEFNLLVGKRKFTLPMISYLASRYREYAPRARRRRLQSTR